MQCQTVKKDENVMNAKTMNRDYVLVHLFSVYKQLKRNKSVLKTES